MISTATIREQPLVPRSEELCKRSWPNKVTVDISLLLKSKDEERSPSTNIAHIAQHAPASPVSLPGSVKRATNSITQLPRNIASTSTIGSSVPVKRSAAMSDITSESPAKRQSKWSPEEDAKIIQLRGDGMKWEDISKHLPGRSAISCRLHYQNYLERRSEWDEDRKNKLARLYERFKSDMWSKIAEEMAIPWRAAEAMHWQMGENEMASRAGVTPFSITTFHSTSNVQHSSSLSTRPTHLRSNSGSNLRRQSAHQMMPMPPQLPSLAELTAGLPAYSHNQASSRPQSFHGSLTPSPAYSQNQHGPVPSLGLPLSHHFPMNQTTSSNTRPILP